MEEATLRRRAGLPSHYLEAGEVSRRFDINRRAALVSSDAFEVDPVSLSLGLIACARGNGASLSYPVDVSAITPINGGVRLVTTKGQLIYARLLVLATGYEAARWSLPKGFKLGLSFAIATAPGTGPLWNEGALLWEAADPYLYARSTVDGRIIIGGEDSSAIAPRARDRMIAAKRKLLEKKAPRLLGREVAAECTWAATFGRSPDGLPAIGKLRRAGSTWLACGFGGNGIAFAALAAKIISNGIADRLDDQDRQFSLRRF